MYYWNNLVYKLQLKLQMSNSMSDHPSINLDHLRNCVKFVAVVSDANVTLNLKFQISIIFSFQDNGV